MIIELDSTGNGELYPEASGILSSDFKLPLYFENYNLRHPLGIYNISIANVFENFDLVTSELDQLYSSNTLWNTRPDWDRNLLQRQRDLLYSLAEHLDDCESIIKCFLPPSIKHSEDYRLKGFLKGTKKYRDHTAKVVNFIKHQHGRLRSIVFLVENQPLPGYYIEGIGDQQSLGPASIIHEGEDTAFSFSRDLRYHFCNFYMVSKYLAIAIDKLVGVERTAGQTKGPNNKRIVAIASRISRLPLIFFPDEIKKPIPNVTIENRNGEPLRIVLQFPDDKVKLQKLPPRLDVQSYPGGDGVSKVWRLPYLKPRKY